MDAKIFYTYLWLREDGTPYYVGKGTGRRAFRPHRVGRAPSRDRVVIQDFESEADAFAAEVFLIEFYGREDLGVGRLLNLSDGGEGASGMIVSDETRRKYSDYHKGRAKSSAHCKAISDGLRGRIFSDETRRKMSVARQGIAPWSRGITFSDEYRRKLSASSGRRGVAPANKGTPMPYEQRQKISKAKKGKPNASQHNRWHRDRWIFNPNCELCIYQITSAPQQLQQALLA